MKTFPTICAIFLLCFLGAYSSPVVGRYIAGLRDVIVISKYGADQIQICSSGFEIPFFQKCSRISTESHTVEFTVVGNSKDVNHYVADFSCFISVSIDRRNLNSDENRESIVKYAQLIKGKRKREDISDVLKKAIVDPLINKINEEFAKLDSIDLESKISTLLGEIQSHIATSAQEQYGLTVTSLARRRIVDGEHGQFYKHFGRKEGAERVKNLEKDLRQAEAEHAKELAEMEIVSEKKIMSIENGLQEAIRQNEEANLEKKRAHEAAIAREDLRATDEIRRKQLQYDEAFAREKLKVEMAIESAAHQNAVEICELRIEAKMAEIRVKEKARAAVEVEINELKAQSNRNIEAADSESKRANQLRVKELEVQLEKLYGEIEVIKAQAESARIQVIREKLGDNADLYMQYCQRANAEKDQASTARQMIESPIDAETRAEDVEPARANTEAATSQSEEQGDQRAVNPAVDSLDSLS